MRCKSRAVWDGDSSFAEACESKVGVEGVVSVVSSAVEGSVVLETRSAGVGAVSGRSGRPNYKG
jgi:hypothetical protein